LFVETYRVQWSVLGGGGQTFPQLVTPYNGGAQDKVTELTGSIRSLGYSENPFGKGQILTHGVGVTVGMLVGVGVRVAVGVGVRVAVAVGVGAVVFVGVGIELQTSVQSLSPPLKRGRTS
jgi:hypothetical protein